MIKLIKRMRYALMLAAAVTVFTVSASVSAGGGAYNNSNYSWFVVWACCGNPQQSGWYNPGSNSWSVTSDGDFFGTSVTHDVYDYAFYVFTLSPFQTFKLSDTGWAYNWGNLSQRPWSNAYGLNFG